MYYNRILKKINESADKYRNMSDAELQAQTAIIRDEISNGATEKKLIIHAFAVIREVDRRILGLYPNDEQVLGAITIYFGNIAEMKTGEGKTLVATMPLFLRALQQKGVYLITTNGYLAHRDYEEMSPVYKWMGLTVSDGTIDTKNDKEAKKDIYRADIVYTANYAIGFDYLINGLADNIEDQFMGEFNFAILDEVDAILLDSAQMPLLISGAPKVQSNFFRIAHNFIVTLKEDVDYKLDEERQSVWLTEDGINSAKDYFNNEELLDINFFEVYRHIVLALMAQFTLRKNKDYLVVDKEVKLLDFKDGRVMEGTRLQSGLQQAVEAKEGVELSVEAQTISSVTFQNLFRKFKILSGMTGTAKTSESEFISTYNMNVQRIKTHKPNLRKDHKRKYFVSFDDKVNASLDKILEIHKTGRPVLIVTESVDVSELYSMYLLNLGIPHTVLNAKNHAKEAMIIKESGRKNAVTVATVMAGRGTDIKITDETVKLGGLAVVLTETMTSLRAELQAKGRAARQGQPGDTYSYGSLEDEVIKSTVQDSIQKYYDQHKNIKHSEIKSPRIKKIFKTAQKKSEDGARNSRLSNLQYDEVMRLQKDVVNQSRDNIMKTTSVDQMLKLVLSNLFTAFDMQFKRQKFISISQLKRFILDNVDYNFKEVTYQSMLAGITSNLTKEEALEITRKIFENNIQKKRIYIDNDQAFLQYLQVTSLKAVDTNWSEQVDSLNQLKSVVSNRASAQRNPILEFQNEARKSYSYYRDLTSQMLFRNVALSTVRIDGKGELVVVFP